MEGIDELRDKIRLFINNIKIENKLIITYLIVAIATVSIVATYLTVEMNSTVITNAITEGENNVSTMHYRIEQLTNLATKVSDMIYSDENLKEILSTDYKDTLSVVNAYNDYPILKQYLKYYNELSNITIYTDNNTLLSSSNILKATDNIKEKKWYKDSVKGNGQIYWEIRRDEFSNLEYLSLVRVIKDSRGKLIGTLVIDINNLNLQAITSSANDIIAVDWNGIGINQNYDLKEQLSGKIINGEVNKDRYVVKSTFMGKESYVIVDSFYVDKSINSKFQSIISLSSKDITERTNKVIIKSLFAIFVAMILSIIFIIYFSKNISRRINILRKEMHRVVNGDLYIKDVIDGNDEIGQLYNDLKFMIESLRNLINQVYIQKIKEEKLKSNQKDAEFKMLSSQINPHFLYNTLETIRMKAFIRGDKEISNIVKKLGKIMRRNLEVSGKPVTLQSEIELIENYLEIQAMRFEGMVNYELFIDKEINTKKYMILPLLLQPIVENAFVHGLEEKKEKGTIIVKIYKQEEKIIIEIEDNGIGIEKSRLDKLNKILNNCEDESNSIGMRNVNQRIKIHYGNDYGIKIESKMFVGTSVKVYLPMGDDKLC